MSGVKVVVFLVRCAENLLICSDLETAHLSFSDAGDCNARLPALIREAQRQAAPKDVVMGRCRFIIGKSMPPAGTTAGASGRL